MNLKEFLVKCSGGECQECGYSKSVQALEYHHILPETKLYEPSKIIKDGLLDKILIELPKCILVCSNCHKEIHAGIIDIPKTYAIFDYQYFLTHSHEILDNCPICHKLKLQSKTVCSVKCSSIHANNIKGKLVRLFSTFLQYNNHRDIAYAMNCSITELHSLLKQSKLILDLDNV
jgi:hypothetical protein